MHPTFHSPSSVLNSTNLKSYITSFNRCFTIKDCLPELPRKIFYDWKKEGLIPDSFGVEKSINVISGAKPSYKKWDRYHLYELIWIRLIYHCRDLGLAKSLLRNAAKENFPASTRLKRRVEIQMRKKNKELITSQKQLIETLGKKGAAHELNKINSTIAEAVESSDFHRNIFNAFSKRKNFDFVLRKGEFFVSETHWRIDAESAKEPVDISPYVGVPFAYILNDVVRNSDLDYLRNLLSLTDSESQIVNVWKDIANILYHKQQSKKIPILKTQSPSTYLEDDQLKARASSCFQLLLGLPHLFDEKELARFTKAFSHDKVMQQEANDQKC